MIFYIPSYKRAHDCRTIDYLLSCGVCPSKIYVSTQTQDDYELYSKNYKGKCNVIFREGNNVSMNRNTCILHARQNGFSRFIMLDDDYDCIMSFVPKRNTRIDGDLFAQFVDGISNLMDKGANLIGLYPISNNMFAMSQKPITRSLLTGRFLAFSTNDYLFDEEYRIKEDYELCLRMMTDGRKVCRLNRFFAKVKLHAKGGCHDDFEKGYSKTYSNKLLTIYPDLLKKGCRDGEIALR